MKKAITILFSILTIVCYTQEKCGTETIIQYRMENYPQYNNAREKTNDQTKKWIEENPQNKHKTIITIPVVVHVVWNTSEENISDAQVQSQINVLNEDFRRTNIDQIMTPNVWQPIAADCEIEFCLATIDPNGQPTTGIERIQTNHGSFGMDNDIHTTALGGSDDWPNDDYLNIWVCDLSGGILGYATPPSSWIGDGDGVVIGYKYFGNMGTATAEPNNAYRKGRTATHEIGHWLNLEHLWGTWGSCGDDQVSDTPKQEGANYDVPAFPHNPNSCGTTNANGDMFMNYLDYTNDAVMNLFTVGQKARMLAAINQYRPNILNHNLCFGPSNTAETNLIQKKLVKIIDFLGRETPPHKKNMPLIYLYNDGSVEKKMIVK